MSKLSSICARWNLLLPLHSLFHVATSLPSVEKAKQGHYTGDSTPADDYHDVEQLENDITILRADFKLNAIKQRQIDSDQFIEDDPNLEGLEAGLENLLKEFESLIDQELLESNEFEWDHEPKSIACFPKLLALRHLHRKEAASTLDTILDGTNPVDNSTESQRCLRPPKQLSSFIQFPRNATNIRRLRRTVAHFGMALNKIQGDSAASGIMEAQFVDYTPQDIETFQWASEFSSTCTSLFMQMVESNKCGTYHQATLHLSGFKKDQLKMNISTCQGMDRVPAVFTRSLRQPPQGIVCIEHLCSPKLASPDESKILHVSFNSQGMWTSDSVTVPDSHANFGAEESLGHLIDHRDALTLKYRKLASVLLAASMFQLIDSPWIEKHLGTEYIFVPPLEKKLLQHWCPLVLCNLMPPKIYSSQGDHIAAFGVTIMELEAHRKADWTAEDAEYGSTERSNHVRLARILTSWKDSVGDNHRAVAKACLEFESRIQSLDHPDIGFKERGLAVIYKFILKPLYHDAINSFGNLDSLFEDMFGGTRMVTAPMSISPSATAKRILFDDEDSVPESDKQRTGSAFLDYLDPFFQKIINIRKTRDEMWYPTYKKIRICVLDSGVDDADSAINRAIRYERINATRSKTFVSPTDDWQKDTHGHGTHVTNLLLKTAPAAEIDVGKICTSKIINDEFMPGIANAIDWAVSECNADIISISFGFEEENELIDAALDNAISAGKLIIAAASNNGGLSGRSRPACREDVICIHATDGKGNKGSMNPSPLPEKDNFATLGVAVPSLWKGEEFWKSGTSFAVPIAVGFAADVLEFARYKCRNLTPRKLRLLHRKEGMQAIFRKMSEKRDGYDFIHPNRLWNGWQEKQAAEAIENIMREI